MEAFPLQDEHLDEKLIAGLARIAVVLRHQGWSEAMELGVSPTQQQIVALLSAGRAKGVSALAEELAVSKATISDSVSALERKALLVKARSKRDARSVILKLTRKGERLANGSSWPPSLLAAANSLSPAERVNLLRALIKIIHSLQAQEMIPVGRMCVSCAHFQPNEYPGKRQQHHCAYAGAPFGDGNLQVDCKDHVAAPAERQAHAFRVFGQVK